MSGSIFPLRFGSGAAEVLDGLLVDGEVPAVDWEGLPVVWEGLPADWEGLPAV